ncbi:MAG: hypothetical protein BA865_11625 [Desulfobacterales bacterium S5133MH4]|nr:MAG: hypothetical protein BA865_11625 [Desulfobacterales bacterium S5133MH4]
MVTFGSTLFVTNFVTNFATNGQKGLALMQERRKYERFDLRLPGKIEVVASGKQEILDVLTGNISAAGGFFHSAKPVPENVQVKIELVVDSKRLEELTGTQGLISVEGTVVRSGLKGTAIWFHKNHQIMPMRAG